jgi:DNA helicase-2/ATP-dependent DNA helicase PcrA
LKGKVRDGIRTLAAGFERWRGMLETDGHVITAAAMLDDSGYIGMWKADKSPEAPGRLENLKELLQAMGDYETLNGFLDHVSLVMENEEQAEADRISLMTMHAAKGLEFDTVFLPGWEEGVFPSQRSMDEGGNKGLEEERRLAYVGLTRARKRAIVSYAAHRQIYGNWQSSIPSRFVDELPEAHLERSGSAALARDARAFAPSVFANGPLMARRPRAVEPWEQAGRPARAEKIAVGQRVFHEKFGYGEVLASEDDKLDIAFEKAGQKRVMDRFVEKA